MKFVVLSLALLFLSCSKNKLSAELSAKTVGILPYNGITKNEIDSVAKAIEEFYAIKTIVLKEREIPKKAFIDIKSPRYRADSIIKFQDRNFPKDVDFVLGLTNKDISITKRNPDGTIKIPKWKYNDFGVMGLAYRPGKSAIISTFRLKSNDRALQLERLKKVSLHEFGHNLGLPHCPDKHCMMTSAAEKISTIDNEQMQLCNDCKGKLE